MTQQERSWWFVNGKVVTPTTVVDPGWVRVVNGQIVEVGSGLPQGLPTDDSPHVVDLHEGWLLPGFIDMHVHGGDGADVMDGTPQSIRRIAYFHASHGTTGWLPTTLTATDESIRQSLRAVARVQQESTVDAEGITGARILGVHLEGPMISVKHKGAQNPEYILPPDWDVVRGWLDEVPGLVRKVTMAPELKGALPVIRALAAEGVIVSIGHTDATLDETLAAVTAGARHITHLFNAMTGLHHRAGGVVGAALLENRVVCELIVDGRHVDFPIVRLVTRLKGARQLVLITDAIAAAGKTDGHYNLGGLEVTVDQGCAYLAHGGNLAGSTLTMDVAIRNLVTKVGVAMPDAVAMASATPARELDLDEKGNIAVGMDADLVWLDAAFSVLGTWVEGAKVFIR